MPMGFLKLKNERPRYKQTGYPPEVFIKNRSKLRGMKPTGGNQSRKVNMEMRSIAIKIINNTHITMIGQPEPPKVGYWGIFGLIGIPQWGQLVLLPARSFPHFRHSELSIKTLSKFISCSRGATAKDFPGFVCIDYPLYVSKKVF